MSPAGLATAETTREIHHTTANRSSDPIQAVVEIDSPSCSEKEDNAAPLWSSDELYVILAYKLNNFKIGEGFGRLSGLLFTFQ